MKTQNKMFLIKRFTAGLMIMLLMLGTVGCAGKAEDTQPVEIRVGSLKGPTSMGLVRLMKDTEEAAAESAASNEYSFTMETAADAITAAIVQGNLDIALVPANVAAILYQRTEGQVTVIDINTLGVLYMVTGNEEITQFSDLIGKTIYLTGKGTTPDFVLQYLLDQNGISENEVTLEYKSEATEVAAVLAENPDSVGLLPQPFVTAACAQNQELSVVLDMTEEWNLVQAQGSMLVTGVTIVRNAFLEQYPEAVAQFLTDHEASSAYANEYVEETAALVAEYGIIEKAPVAQAALPKCNITFIAGEEMKTALEGYLTVLFEQSAESVGGSLPGDNFYLIG